MIKKRNKGFTLVEILVAIVISVISVSAIISSYQYFNKTNKLVSQKALVSQAAREALSMITRDLRNAGYQDINYLKNRPTCGRGNNNWIGIRTVNKAHSNSDELVVYYTASVSDRRYIRYEHYYDQTTKNDPNQERLLAREEINNAICGNPEWKVIHIQGTPLVQYVTDFQIVLKNKAGNEIDNDALKNYNHNTINNEAYKALQKTIHTAEVYLTLRSPEEVYKENKTIRIINHTQPDGTDMTITDKYYRETFFVSVHTRNLAKASVPTSTGSTTTVNTGTTYNP